MSSTLLVRKIGLFLLTLFASFIFWRLGEVFAFILMTFIIGLAIVGGKNWKAWSGIFVLSAGIFVVIFLSIGAIGSTTSTHLVGILGFGLLPLMPTLLIWFACLLRTKQRNQ